MQQTGKWVIANIYTGEVAPDTASYADMDAAGQVLHDLVAQGRLKEGDWEIRPAPASGGPAEPFTPTDY